MAWMEMDCNLKQLANFFQVPPVYFGKIAKHWLQYIFPWRNHFIFSSRYYRCSFMSEKMFLTKFLHSYGSHKVKSP